MRVIVEKDYAAMSRRAAGFVAALVRRKPRCVLGLATGSTPVGLYRELIRLHKEEGLDFAPVVTFNLDEYYGLPPDHDQSYRHFMKVQLFDHINIHPKNAHVPDGLVEDVEAYCAQYEEAIRQAGGIDLQVLGIGSDGHIAFNEPGSSLGSRTRLKTLTADTIRDNARFFASEGEVPRFAITMGVGTILESRRLLLLASGIKKAKVVAQAIEGAVTAQVTASVLQLHREVIVVLDEEAAHQLQRREYYDHVEAMTAEWEKGRRRPTTVPSR